MPISVGSVSVDVIPNTQGIYQRLNAPLVQAGDRAGQNAGQIAGQRFGAAMAGAVPNSIGVEIGRQIGTVVGQQVASAISRSIVDGVQGGGRQSSAPAVRAGDDTGGAFARGLKARLDVAFRSMPKLNVNISDTGVDAELARVRAQMETLSNKRIGIDIDVATADAQIEAMEAELVRLGSYHPNVAVRADTAAALAQLAAVREELARVSATPGQVRLETDGSFGAKLRAQVAAAQASLPEINVTASTDDAQARVAALRARLATLSNARIGIDLDAATALERIAAIRAALTEVAGSNASIDVRVDAARAEAELAAVSAEADALGAQDPRVNVRVDTGDAQGKLFALAVELGILAAIQVGPVIAAGLGGIVAAAGAAAIGIGALVAVAIPAISSIKNVLQLQTQAQQQSTSATGAGGAAASQAAQKALQLAGAQQSLADAERNGARQIAQAQKQVTAAETDVATARKAAADAATQAAQQNAQAAQQVVQAEKDVATARQAAADAATQAAQQNQQAAAQVASAQRDVVRAEQQVGSSERDLAAAQRTAQQAQKDLTQARADATRALEDENNSLADAQLSQRQAVLDLQDATATLAADKKAGSKVSAEQLAKDQLGYDQAAQHVKEQGEQVDRLAADTAAANAAGVDGSKTVLSAQQSLADAQQDVVDKATALANAQQDLLDKELAVARAEQAQAQQRVKGARQVAAAQQAVQDKITAVAAAELAQAQQRVKGAEQVAAAQQGIAAAQQKVADAQGNVTQAQEQSASAITAAQRGIQSANLSTASSAATAETAQQKYQAALDKLSPSARTLLTSFVNLKTGFLAWSTSLQPAVLPLFSRALDGLGGSLTKFSPLVVGAASGVAALEDKLGRELKTPFWKGFLADLTTAVPIALVGLGVTFGNIFKGLAGFVDAFLPHMTGVSAEMEKITGRFAKFGSGLKVNPAFTAFLDYVKQSGPGLSALFAQLFTTLGQVSQALAPIAGPVLRIVTSLAQFVGWLAKVNPGLLQGIYLAALAFKAMQLSMVLVNAGIWAYNAAVALAMVFTDGWAVAIQATGIVPIIEAIIVVIALLVIGVIYAYNHFTWFHDIVSGAIHGVATVALWLWNSVLKPSFDGIVIAISAVATAAVWLWQNVLVPAFNGIMLVAKVLLAVITVLVVAPILIAFHLLSAVVMSMWKTTFAPAFAAIGTIATWLWKNAISPAFNGIANLANWLYNNGIKPGFTLIQVVFRAAATVGSWLYNNALAPAFRGIATVAGWLYNTGIKPAFNAIATVANWLWKNGLSPAFNAIKTGVSLVGTAFQSAVTFIGRVWGGVEDIAKKPINFVINSVYTHGIKAVWDEVAGFVGLGKLPNAPKLLEAGGTVGPGWGPAAPMKVNRPTAIVGEGNPNHPEYVIPTDPKYRARARALHQAAGSQLMAGGGIIGSAESLLGSAAKGLKSVGTAAWNGITDMGDIFLHPTAIWSKISAPIRALINQVGNFPFDKLIGQVPVKMLNGLGTKIADFVTGGGGGTSANGGIGGALLWAKSQAGKPYQWGGVGNPSWDCSGFMGGIESVMLHQNPDRRLFTTQAFQGSTAPAGWTQNAASAFRIGVTNAGVGHMAGTIGGTNVESQGTFGVLAGPRARGWSDPLFTEHYGYTGKFDSGGYLPTGLSTVYNGTGKPEPVLTNEQWAAIGGGGKGDGRMPLTVNYMAPTPENPEKAAMEISRRVNRAVSI